MSSYFGCLDLCGFPKAAFYIRQAFWIHDRPVLTLVPHWNWPGREGQAVKVMALTNADTVALFLNGRLIEEKPVGKFDMVQWQVPYAPGRLEAVAKKDGKDVARYSVETTGEPTQVQLTPDRTAINADGEDVAVFTVSALDAQGRVVPVAHNKINFTIAGGGQIIGVGNGDPTCHEPDVFLPPGPRLIAINDWRWTLGTFAADKSESIPVFAPEFDDSSWATAKRGEKPLNGQRDRDLPYPRQADPGRPRCLQRPDSPRDDGRQRLDLRQRPVRWRIPRLAGPAGDRDQEVPAAGDNIIAVRVKNDGGPGGLDPVADLLRGQPSAGPLVAQPVQRCGARSSCSPHRRRASSN